MKRQRILVSVLALGLLLTLVAGLALAQGPVVQGEISVQGAVGTTFTYQGRLLSEGAPVDGTCDFEFSLWTDLSGGSQVAAQGAPGKEVKDGYFSVDLNFGSGFTGDARYLQIVVNCGSGGATLDPRVALNAAPYAHSLRPGAVIEGTSTGNILSVQNTSTSGYGVYGKSGTASGKPAIFGVGVWGDGDSSVGVYGTSNSSGGVLGFSTSDSGVAGMSTSGNGVDGASTSGNGVYGETSGSTGTPYGVYGLASNAGSAASFGVYGESNSSVGTGVGGEAPMNGVYGKATSTSGYGVYGEATASSGTTYGVYGKTNSSSGHGVYGTSPSTNFLYAGVTGANTGGGAGAGVYGYSLGGYGVHGRATAGTGVYGTAPTTGTVGIATGSSGKGVYGYANAGSGTTYGVYGKADSLSGKGVYGEGGYHGLYGVGTDPTGTSLGVYGKTDTTGTGYGVYGEAANTTTGYGGYFRALNGAGLFAEGDTSSSGVDVRLGGDDGVIVADENANSSLHLHSNAEIWLYLDDDNSDTTSRFEIFSNGALFSSFDIDQAGNLYAAGNIACGGTKSAVVDTENYGTRKLYAVESPELWFEDFGAGTLVNGVATVGIEPIFAETINLEEYHVFLTPLGDCNGLYVAAKTPTSFEVRELGGGTANVSFDYRIVAHRLGYEDVRLEEVQK